MFQISGVALDHVQSFVCLGIRFNDKLSWSEQIWKSESIMSQSTGTILHFMNNHGGRLIEPALQDHKMKTMTATIYDADLQGYRKLPALQKVENRLLLHLFCLGLG